MTREDLDRAVAQGNLKVGSLLLIRYGLGDLQSFDYGFVSFSRVRGEDLARANRNFTAAAPGTCETATYDLANGVETGNFGRLGEDFFTSYLFWGGYAPLEAGERVNVSGPGKTMAFGKIASGMYSNFAYDPTDPGSFGGALNPGNYTLEGTGGQHVPAFRTTFNVPETIRFAGSMQVTVPRSRDYTVRWTGGSPSERVLISGWSYSISPLAVGAFQCVARSDAKSFTIPASVLSAMPASDNMAQGFGYLIAYSFAPLQRTAVDGLDAFYSGVMNLSYQSAKFE
jgi:hypothetical protein